MSKDLSVTVTAWLIFLDGLLAALVWGLDQKSVEPSLHGSVVHGHQPMN